MDDVQKDNLERIHAYKTLFEEKQSLFRCQNPEERAKEIITVYDSAKKAGYQLDNRDTQIIRAAETITKTIQYNREIVKRYPDALERVSQYQQDHREHKLVDTEKVKEKMREIIDVYHAATQLGYKQTKEDRNIRMLADFILHPELLETIITRIESDDIVDENGNTIKK